MNDKLFWWSLGHLNHLNKYIFFSFSASAIRYLNRNWNFQHSIWIYVEWFTCTCSEYKFLIHYYNRKQTIRMRNDCIMNFSIWLRFWHSIFHRNRLSFWFWNYVGIHLLYSYIDIVGNLHTRIWFYMQWLQPHTQTAKRKGTVRVRFCHENEIKIGHKKCRLFAKQHKTQNKVCRPGQKC